MLRVRLDFVFKKRLSSRREKKNDHRIEGATSKTVAIRKFTVVVVRVVVFHSMKKVVEFILPTAPKFVGKVTETAETILKSTLVEGEKKHYVPGIDHDKIDQTPFGNVSFELS